MWLDFGGETWRERHRSDVALTNNQWTGIYRGGVKPGKHWYAVSYWLFSSPYSLPLQSQSTVKYVLPFVLSLLCSTQTWSRLTLDFGGNWTTVKDRSFLSERARSLRLSHVFHCKIFHFYRYRRVCRCGKTCVYQARIYILASWYVSFDFGLPLIKEVFLLDIFQAFFMPFSSDGMRLS